MNLHYCICKDIRSKSKEKNCTKLI